MIELGIVDLSASGRRRLSALIERWSWAPPDGRVSLPRLSLHLLSPEEVRFHGSVDVCVVGPEIVGSDAAFINNLRQHLPDKIILCVLDSRAYSFGLVEQLGRLGVDDVLIDSATSDEFFRRILLLQRRVQSKKKGRLVIVDSARGGVGRTFAAGESACLVDCDVISQDLSRFLQVRPYVNEPLRLLIDQQRVVTTETVSECTRAVWLKEPRLVCVAPPAGGDEALFSGQHAQRGLVAVLDVLLIKYDRVIVDTSGLLSSARNALFQVCDELFFVANRDASAAYANRQALSLIAGFLRPAAKLTTILNDNGVGGVSISLLKDEVVVVAGRQMSYITIPRVPQAATWVCSGHTPYRYIRRSLRNALALPSQPRARQPIVGNFLKIPNEWGVGWLKGVEKVSSLRGRIWSWLRRNQKSGSVDSWGVPSNLAVGSLRALNHGLPEEGALVTKPVLLS